MEDGDEFDVHLATQKEPVFLLGRESQAARFFASSSDAERLLRMQKLFRDRVAAKKHERAHHQRERARVGEELQALQPLDDLNPQVTLLRREHESLIAAAARHHNLAESAADLQDLERRHTALGHELQPLQQVRQPPLLDPEEPLSILRQDLRSALLTHKTLTAEHNACGPLRDPPEMREVHDLERITVEMHEALDHRRTGHAVQTVCRQVMPPPEMSEPDALENALRALSTEQAARDLWNSRFGILAPLPPPPELADETPLEGTLTQIQTEAKALAAARAEHDASALEFQQWITAHPTCPHCGSRLNPESGTGVSHAH